MYLVYCTLDKTIHLTTSISFVLRLPCITVVACVKKDLQLVWQATVRRAPVNMAVATLGTISGMVCSLDDEGVLTACYQGTDPPTSAVVAAETKEVDYDQINVEHRKLLQVSAKAEVQRRYSNQVVQKPNRFLKSWIYRGAVQLYIDACDLRQRYCQIVQA